MCLALFYALGLDGTCLYGADIPEGKQRTNKQSNICGSYCQGVVNAEMKKTKQGEGAQITGGGILY